MPIPVIQPSIPGMVQPPTLDVFNRPISGPRVKVGGKTATVLSMSFGTDQGEVLVPRVSPDGRILTEQQAIAQYRKTGQHLGIFADPDSADRYAEQLHQQQQLTLGQYHGR